MQTHSQRVLQIEAESGLDLLAGLLHSAAGPSQPTSTSGVYLGIKEIDSILHNYGGLESGDVLDLMGGACSGKTTALYAIIISTVLPRFWRHSQGRAPFNLEGRSKSVMFMDMDCGFSADRLRTLISTHVIARFTSQQSQEAEEQTAIDIHSQEFQAKLNQLATSCLQKVHVFRPPSATTAIVMLRSMDQYLSQVTPLATPSSGSPFALMILDSVSSFFWQEKLHSNHTRSMSQLVDALNRLARRWKLVFVTTSWLIPTTDHSTLDRTTTDALRARIKFRFQLHPRILDRYPTERELIEEWMTRRGPASVKQLEGLFSLFQAQMVIPSAEHKEVFRMSISDQAGVEFYRPPFLS
ncbi:MAG: hypothetical protein BYD32DRAFT_418057 [Podila humilis]|nr:MAG: hypothetical protein BYD32DRAFT_418057 [Podila humilis]